MPLSYLCIGSNLAEFRITATLHQRDEQPEILPFAGPVFRGWISTVSFIAFSAIVNQGWLRGIVNLTFLKTQNMIAKIKSFSVSARLTIRLLAYCVGANRLCRAANLKFPPSDHPITLPGRDDIDLPLGIWWLSATNFTWSLNIKGQRRISFLAELMILFA